jgi:hypothetical protein
MYLVGAGFHACPELSLTRGLTIVMPGGTVKLRLAMIVTPALPAPQCEFSNW